MRRKILKILGIFLLFVFAFFAAFFLMLPTDSIRHYVEKTLEKQFKHEQSVEIESLSVSPLLNITAQHFSMMPRTFDAEAANLATDGGSFNGYYCAPYVELQQFVIDEIFVKPSILSLIQKKPSGAFNLKLQDGLISGTLQAKGNLLELTANAEDISLNEFALLSNLSRMQIYGNMAFDARAIIQGSSLAELSLTLDSLNTVTCPKRFKLDVQGLPFIELPFTVFGNIHANLEIKKDKLIIHSLTSDGPDIKLDIKGDVALKSTKTPLPRFNLEATITPSQAWIDDNNMGVIYQICEKLDDGSIKLSLKGTSKKIKHECGTPIQNPTPAPQANDENANPTPSPTEPEATKTNSPKISPRKAKNLQENTEPQNTPDSPARARPAQRGRIQSNDATPAPRPRTNRPELSERPKLAPEIERKLDNIDQKVQNEAMKDSRVRERMKKIQNP